ncbi:hypothetical protein ES332_A07G213100v1 [Gossypium tomentosum]|uniref:Uncharacterized protein n=1 Tax=Gossypium tomentosum TaxID=34277 RepID=A0A5D2PYL4_GOSTO|nr:hypothetical protein ES332_A07G213100v1 [Gossypium tomentosum]
MADHGFIGRSPMSHAANGDQRYIERVSSTLFLNGFEVGTITTTATQGKREDPSAPHPLPRPLVEPQGCDGHQIGKRTPERTQMANRRVWACQTHGGSICRWWCARRPLVGRVCC